MGKYYCDYCDVYLTHDSPAVRKQHNDGNRHKQSVCDYYRDFVGKRTQRRMDQIVAAFEERVTMGLVVPTFGFAEAPVKVQTAEEQQATTAESEKAEVVSEANGKAETTQEVVISNGSEVQNGGGQTGPESALVSTMDLVVTEGSEVPPLTTEPSAAEGVSANPAADVASAS